MPADISAVIGLGREFAEYENLLDTYTVTEDKLRDVIFGDDRFAEMLVAESDGVIIGYALFYPSFASFRGERSMFLEDIYISPDHRRGGVGEAILREIARLSRSQGCERIDFQVLDWNLPAIEFYQKLGAVCNEDERHFKFDGDAFANLVR